MRISLCAPASAEGAWESCAERGPSASPRAGSPGGGKGTRSPRGVVCVLPCHGQSQSPGQAPSQGVGRHLLPMEVRETAESQGKSGENRRQLRNRSGRQAHSIHVFAAFSLSLSVLLFLSFFPSLSLRLNEIDESSSLFLQIGWLALSKLVGMYWLNLIIGFQF